MLSRSYTGRTESQSKEGSMFSRTTEERGKQERPNALLSVTCAEENARGKLLSWKPTQKDGK